MRVLGRTAVTVAFGVVAAVSVPGGSAWASQADPGRAGPESATVGVLATGSLAGSAGTSADSAIGAVRLASDEEWLADRDVNSLYSITRSAGVQGAWSQLDRAGNPLTGAGVGVALIDSGVAPVPGLDGPGKVINGPDLSFESQADNLRYLDTFGHGTHLAGIIAGRDAGVTDTELTAPGRFVGVAPGAHLINIKVAAADGATDVSQVIAAIDWAVRHRDDPGLNIRVLNLSFGTDSMQDARLDPLSYAVEAAWKKGIVVVVAVGNDGASQDRVAMPAANPYVIAAGAVDPNETETRRDDTVASFSTGGNAVRHADILAAGRSVVSLRNPGSYVDTLYPNGRLANDSAQRFFRGSGTSQATAVVSGAVALLLQQRPELQPDQVKRLLTTSAEALPGATGVGFGTGQLNLGRALQLPAPGVRQEHPAATGAGTIEGARGSAHVADPDSGVELTGERDIFGQPWRPEVWAPAAASGVSWTGGVWNGSEWTGSDWTGTSWAGRTWGGVAWAGTSWAGSLWSGRTWNEAVWNGRTWNGRTWNGRTWNGRTWGGGYWS